MKRFLFKFFFVLMALIAAIPAQAATIYFKNTVGWSTVYVHFYSDKCWDNNGTSATSPKHVSVTPMKIIDGTDIYSCEYNGDYSVVAFTKEEQSNYNNFHANEVAYREDFSTSKPLFTPDNNQHTDINNCKYYNVGTWSEYSEPLQTQLAAPTFSPAGGAYTSAQSVTISAAEGAKIYYTTNKTVPTTSSTEYSGPITVNETTTIRAIAVKDGYTNSEIAEATYTINNTPTPTTGKIYVPVSEYDKTVAYIYSWDANNDNYKLFGDKGTPMTKETVNGVAYWTVTVESSKLPATVTGWILHNGNWQDKASNNNNTDLPGVTFQDGYVYHINGTSEPIIYINAPTFSPEGGEITSAQNVTISAADGATIYYTTDGNDPTTSSSVYSEPITVSKTTTIKAIAVKDGHTSSIASATYTLVEPECWYLPDASTSNAVQMKRNADGSFSLTIDIANNKTFIFSKKQSTATADILGSTAAAGTDYWIEENKLNTDLTLVSGTTQKFIMKAGESSYKITVSADYSKVKLVENTAQAGDIPVYPAGVNSEAELNAYDFEANPVYYLLADVLNDNRVTPEWQLTKGADGLYHLNGFAMRNTGAVKVRQYTSANTYVDYDSKSFTTALSTSEGQLYNATFNPNGNSLSLTPASGTKMPFISLVGYMMQQDQVYDTPRGVEGTPVGTKSSTGWQEAWLLYDANGKLLKDRKGNVMYSTMWPPKNPVYFTATIGSNQRLYSSDQMTFVPVQKDGNNVGKTGAEWKAELEKLDEEAYKGLSLDPNKTYYRYVVSDIWYVGAGKIWTGWGGETTNSDKGLIANWSKHKNWGYEDKNANDTDGTPINAQTTYNVVTDKGNFLFNDPTYFKTFEFFYETGKPNENSQIYTTLAYGSASIAAQNVKEGDSYTKGSYQATVTVPEDMTISSWKITRHDATNDALAPIGSDNGVVATSDDSNFPTEFTNDKEGLGEGRYYYELTVTFSNAATETNRTSTVRSNPFVIYFPNEYSLDANGYQLVKLDNATDDGYSYATYNAKANGDLYFVNLTTDNKVANFRVATSAEREKVNGYFAANSGIKWTDKVFVYAPVPAEFKVDAEKAEATVSLDQIVNYDVNATKGVTPVNYELAVVDNKGNFANKVYKAVMNYQEKDAYTGALGDVKSSLGKENLTVMQMPNVKGGEATVTVTPTENSAELSIDYNGTTKKATPAAYYTVSVELPFSDPNVEVEQDNAPQYEVKVTDANGTTTKVYTASGTGERALTFTNVNPLDFAGKSIEVNAKYFDGEGYNLYANLGESAKLASGTAAFTSGCKRNLEFIAVKSKAPVLDDKGNMIKDDKGYHKQKDVIVVSNMHYTHDGVNDKIAGTVLAVNNSLCNVDFTIDTNEAYSNVYSLSDLDFDGESKFNEQTGHHYWTASIQFDNPFNAESPTVGVAITPFYVAQVTNTEGTVGLNEIGVELAPVVKAEDVATTYVALPCETANASQGGLTTGIVDITEGSNMKAYKVIENGEIRIIYGDRKFNVMGAEVK